MANSVKINLELAATGVKEQVAASKAIADNYERANKAASNIRAANAEGGTTSSRGVANRATPVSEREYGQVRGAVGTGAAGRDFAKQAQGLGGVVALYATFAANIFAVGAAFEALNKAAAVERLAKATHLMSMQVGVNLKSISQNLVEASGHALSFADAMQFTNIGTSAGLAGKQIENLTKIARGAASALGRDANDSVRRIIQGTAKQEQEILDELGIFVKSKKAFDKYASEIGVKADDLSGLQRTQAYANEVERLGEKWKEFAEIPDPFSKFTATGKNALNEILGVLSSVLSPILEVLSKSEAAIAAIILTITASLAKRAMPELGSMFNSFFSYDKQVATKQIDDAIANLNVGLVKARGNIKKYQDEIATISLLPKFDAAAIEKQFKEFRAEKVKGKYSGGGVRVQPLISDLIGTANNPKDISHLKSVEEIEGKILANVKAQLKGKADTSVLMDDFIRKGVLDNASKVDGLLLSEKIKTAAAEAYKAAQANINAPSSVETALKGETAALKQAEEMQGKVEEMQAKRDALTAGRNNASIEKTRLTAQETLAQYDNAKATLALQQSGVNYAAVKQAEINMRRASVALIVEETALKQKEAMSSVAGDIQAAGASGGMLSAPFKALGAMGSKMGEQFKLMKEGITSAAAAGNVSVLKLIFTMDLAKLSALGLGTGFNMLKIAALGLGTAVGLLLGPISIIITLWSMFGDKLTDFLGITSDATRALDEAKKQQAEYSKTLEYSGAQLENLTKMRKESIGALDSESFYINKVISNLNNLNTAYDETQKKRDAKAAADTVEAAKRDAESKGQAFNPTVYQARGTISATEGFIPEGTAQGLKELTDGLDKLVQEKKKADDAFSWTLGGDAYVAAKERMAEADRKVLEGEKKLHEFTKGPVTTGANQTASATEKAKNATTAMIEVLDKELERRKKLADPSLNTTTAEATQLMVAYKNSVESGGTAAGKTADMYKILSTSILLGGQTQVIAIAIATKLAAGMAEIDKLGLKTVDDLAARTAFLAGLSKEMTALGNTLGKPTAPKAPKAISPFDDATKDSFVQAKKEINDLGIAIKRMGTDSSIAKAMDDSLASITKVASAESIRNEKNREYALADITNTKAQKEAYDALQHVLKDRTKKGDEGARAKDEAYAAYANTLAELDLSKQSSKVLADINAQKSETNRLATVYALQIAATNREEDNIAGKAKLALDIEANKLLLRQESGLYTTQEITDAQNLLDIKNQQLATANSLRALESSKATESAPLLATINNEGVGSANGQAALTELVRINEEYAKSEGLIKANDSATLSHLANTGAMKAYLASTTDQMNLMVTLTDTLTGAFGDLGTNIGLAGKSLLKMAQDEEAYAKDKKVMLEKLSLADASSGVDKTELLKEQTALDKKNTKTQITNMANVAGATKKMFSEKTAAYKIASAAEKAIHVYKMTMWVAENGAMLANAVTSIATSGTKAVAAGGEATVKAAADTPGPVWVKVAAGLAMAAFVASLIGGSSKGSAPPGGMSAEDQQETQGTGMSWVNGQKVENGGGVYGDPTAKSESIQNSLDILNATQVEGMGFFSKQVELLTKIKDGIKNLANNAAGIPGMRTGTIGGVVEGSRSSGGGIAGAIFGKSSSSTSIINSGIQLAGTFLEAASAGKKFASQFQTVSHTSSKSGFLGFGSSSSTNVYNMYQALGDDIMQDLSGIFASARQMFVDNGKAISNMSIATVDSILASVNISRQISLRGLTGDALAKELMAVVSSILDESAAKLFPQLKKFRAVGEGFQETVTRVRDGFDKVNLAFRSMGTSTISFSETLVGATQEQLDAQRDAREAYEASTKAIPEQEYGNKRFGKESYIWGVLNLAQIAKAKLESTAAYAVMLEANKAVSDANTTLTTKNFDLSDALIKAAGSLENFINSAKTFSEIFMSEKERTDIKSNEIRTTLGDLSRSNLQEQINMSGTANSPSANPTRTTPGGAGTTNALWEGVLNEFWTAHVNRYRIGWNTWRTTEAERQGNYNAMLTEYSKRNIATNIEVSRSMVETNGVAMQMFRTFSDGNDGIIDTRQEYRRLKEGVEAYTKSVGISDDQRTQGVALYTKLMNEDFMTGFDNMIKAEEELAKARRDQATELLRLKGLTWEATLHTREDKLVELSNKNPALVQGQQDLYDQEDLNKTRDLWNSLLVLQGGTYEALIITRDKELLTLSDTDKAIKRAIYAQEDYNKSIDLTTNLLGAQGYAHEVLIINRNKELLTLSSTDKAIKLAIYAQEDYNKSIGLYTDLLSAQGKTYEALTITREKELRGLSDVDRSIKLAIYRQEDLNKSRGLETQLLTAQGRSYEVLLLNRELELEALSSSDKVRARLIYNEEDLNKTRNLEIQILKLQKKDTEALTVSREYELRALSTTDKALQQHIWNLEDLADAQKNYDDAVSNTESALSSREDIREQATNNYLSATDRVTAAQQRITAIHGEAAISMANFSKSIRDLVEELMSGESSLDGGFAAASTRFASLLELARKGDTQALETVGQAGSAVISTHENISTSAFDEEFNRFKVISGLLSVAGAADRKSKASNLLAGSGVAEDPSVAAQRELEAAITAQTVAAGIANTIGASLVASQEKLIEKYEKAEKAYVDALAKEAAANQILQDIKFNTAQTSNRINELKSPLLIELTLAAKSAIERTITLVEGSTMTDTLKRQAYGIGTEIKRAVELLFASTSSDTAKAAAFDAVASGTRAINLITASSSSAEAKANAFDAVASGIRTIKLITASTSSDVSKAEAFQAVASGTRTIELITASTSSSEAKSNAFNAVAAGNRTIGLALSRTSSEAARSAAFDAVAAGNRSILLQLDNVALSSYSSAVATATANINKVVALALTDFNPTDAQKIINASAAATKQIIAALGSGNSQALSLALAESSNLTRTVGAIGGGALTTAQIAVLNAVENGSATVTANVGGNVTWTPDATTTAQFAMFKKFDAMVLYLYLVAEYTRLIAHRVSEAPSTINSNLTTDKAQWDTWQAEGRFAVLENRGYAKGGAFVNGVEAFATGGSFTNGIVDRATNFNMGLMGEAGPEAIMPLHRDASGSLGVKLTRPAPQSNNNEELVREIRALRKEVADLRIANSSENLSIVRGTDSSAKTIKVIQTAGIIVRNDKTETFMVGVGS